jgi:2-polyprenyl-3-methyl-5-hydroxy-6-metoxy-1,4-benzoquinol methylase
LDDHLDRFLITLDYIPKKRGKVLELGSVPPFMAIQLGEMGYNVTTCHYAEEEYDGKILEDTYFNKKEGKKYAFKFHNFNSEKERFPFLDKEFDIALCCEVIEHLMQNPVYMLAEIHRVLKEGGTLLLSTPNAMKAKYFIQFLSGKNIFYPYSTHGAYGRHNREFSLEELENLLKLCNFKIKISKVVNLHKRTIFEKLVGAILDFSGRKGGEQIFIVAEKVGPTKIQMPPELFNPPSLKYFIKIRERHPEYTTNCMKMGENDLFHLKEGWYELENWPPNIRWTRGEASALLRKSKDDKFVIVRLCAHRKETAVLIKANRSEKKFAINWGWHDLKVPLAEDEKEGLEVTIKTLTPLLHDAWGKELGVAVEKIWLME